jgi:hypothetical protein
MLWLLKFENVLPCSSSEHYEVETPMEELLLLKPPSLLFSLKLSSLKLIF